MSKINTSKNSSISLLLELNSPTLESACLGESRKREGMQGNVFRDKA